MAGYARALAERAAGGHGIAQADVPWLLRALDVSFGSHDRHSRAGAVVIAADGRVQEAANRIPDGVSTDDEDRFSRAEKSDWIEHAELLALFASAACGAPTRGGTLYSSRFPCAGCARGIVASGIRTVVAPDPEFDHPRRGKSFRRAHGMLSEAKVELRLAGKAPDRWPEGVCDSG